MPYIKPEERDGWNASMLELGFRLKTKDPSPGVLNYVITRVLCLWLGLNFNYERINAAIGVLECAKLELYRKVAADYENTKCAENGDVYPLTKSR